MINTYFTIAGTKYHFGSEFLEKGMKVVLKKEPDNEYDKEAIIVEMEGLGKVGYVANSPHTVIGESFSAGRLYDKIGSLAEGEVMHVLPQGILCKLSVEGTSESEEIVEPDDYIIKTRTTSFRDELSEEVPF